MKKVLLLLLSFFAFELSAQYKIEVKIQTQKDSLL